MTTVISNAFTVPSAQTSALAAAAAGLSAGQSVEVAVGAMGAAMATSTNGNDTLFNYMEKFYWDAARSRAIFFGKGLSGNELEHLEYTDNTNTWAQIGAPPFAGASTTGHGYDQSTFDPATGDIYWIDYNSNTVHLKTYSTGTWSTLTAASNTGSVATGLEWHPNLYGSGDGGLVLVGALRIQAWRKSTANWATIQVPSGYQYHCTAAYCTSLDSVICSGGNGVATAYSVASGPTVSAITDFPIGPSSSNDFATHVDAPDGNGTILLETATASRVWRYNGSWTLLGSTHPFYNNGSQAQVYALCSIPEYGVIWGQLSNSPNNVSSSWIYKP